MTHFGPTTAEEKRWEAESDAQTLSEAKIISGDENRLSAAKVAADRLAEEAKERAEALEKVKNVQSGAVGKQKNMFPNTPKD